MKIVKPTLNEAREYYSKNRNYYEQLSGYYSVHDPEFHKNIFLKIENANKVKPISAQKKVLTVYAFTILILISLSILYVFPFRIVVGYTKYDISEFSLFIKGIELTDFEKGMDKYNRLNYIQAMEYFKKVNINDENYLKSLEMTEVCSKKIDEEGVTQSDDKYDEENETDRTTEDDNLIH